METFLLIILAIVISIVIVITRIRLGGISRSHGGGRTSGKETPSQKFYRRTDKLWTASQLMHGSFDKIPRDKKNRIFERMQEIADEVGYKEFEKDNYIKHS